MKRYDKKEIGMALQEIRAADWFKELDSEMQQHALDMQKSAMGSPDEMQNALINAALVDAGWETWEMTARQKGWVDPWAPCGVDKKEYFTHWATLNAFEPGKQSVQG